MLIEISQLTIRISIISQTSLKKFIKIIKDLFATFMEILLKGNKESIQPMTKEYKKKHSYILMKKKYLKEIIFLKILFMLTGFLKKLKIGGRIS